MGLVTAEASSNVSSHLSILAEPVLFRHAVDVADEVEVLEAGQSLVNRRKIRNIGRHLLGLERLRGHVVPFDHDPPRVGPQQSDDHLEGRRLPGPVRPQEPEDLAGLDRQRQVVDGLDLAPIVAFRYVRQLDHLTRLYFTSKDAGASGILSVSPAAKLPPALDDRDAVILEAHLVVRARVESAQLDRDRRLRRHRPAEGQDDPVPLLRAGPTGRPPRRRPRSRIP